MEIRPYEPGDLPGMTRIWNQVVEEGTAFPQEECLDDRTAASFFAGQTLTAVAEEEGRLLGLYILHPNNVGRCGHSANASYAVDRALRGKGVGRALVEDCLARAGALGYRLLQFNAVVASNTFAIRLYESLGFQRLGVLPGGFRDQSGTYQDTILFYHTL